MGPMPSDPTEWTEQDRILLAAALMEGYGWRPTAEKVGGLLGLDPEVVHAAFLNLEDEGFVARKEE